MMPSVPALRFIVDVSVLFNEPKLLKFKRHPYPLRAGRAVSVLFNEPKLLKSVDGRDVERTFYRFSALQRAEIAEIA